MTSNPLSLPKPNISALHRTIAASVALLLVWLFLLNTKLQWLKADEQLLLTLLYICCVLPGVLFIGGHRLRVPVMPLWGIGYFALFGMPMISGAEELAQFDSRLVAEALGLAVLGALCCLAAFYTPLMLWLESFLPPLRWSWDPRRAPKSGVLLCLVGITANYLMLSVNLSSALGQPLYLLSLSATVGTLTLFLLQMRGALSLRLKLFLWGFVVPILYLFGIGTGAVYKGIIVLAPMLFCYCAEKRRLPVFWTVLILSVFVVPFLGFKGEYRSYAWQTEGDVELTSSPAGRGLFFVQLVIKRLTEGGLESYSVALETAEQRASHLELLADVMEQTPAVVPFWNGETYASVLWTLIPRFLYPNKPQKRVGQEFGHRYGILEETDLSTSVNLPHQVVEMYINFGKAGVVLGMLVIGTLYRAISVLLGRPGAGERSLIIGCTICAILLNQDSDFSLVFGGVVYCLAVLYIVSTLFHGNAPAPKKAGAA